MRTITKLLFATLTALMLLSNVNASTVVREYPLPDHGHLILSVVDGWSEDVKPPKPGAPKTLWFTARNGATFNVMITPITAPDPGQAVPGDDAIRKMVESSAKKLESQSVEKSLTVQELTGPNCRGYFFAATDSAPAPGEWKYLRQGFVRVGAIAVGFTVLTNDGQEQVVRAAMEMIRHASYRAPDTGQL